MDDASEFAAVPIRDDQLVAWPRVAAISAMVGFSLVTFVTGLEIYAGMSPSDALWAVLGGSLIAAVIGALTGYIGASNRMSSYLLARVAFGDKGAAFINIAFAVSLIGWFGVQINLFTETVAQLSNDLWGINPPKLLLAIMASFVMTLTTFLGFNAINKLSTALVPIMVIVTFLFAKAAFSDNSFGEFMAQGPPPTAAGDGAMSIGTGMSIIVGLVIVGAIVLPDITRFARQKSGAVYTAILTYFVIQVLVLVVAGLAALATGTFDAMALQDNPDPTQTLLKLMFDVNLGIGAFLIVVASTWILNAFNLYSAVLSTKATFPKLNAKVLTIVLGAVGVGAALMNILSYFETFLWYLSILFIPMAGVLIIDRFFIRSDAYNLGTLDDNNHLNLTAIGAWAIAAIIAIMMERKAVPTATGIGTLDALLLSVILYFGFAKIFGRKLV